MKSEEWVAESARGGVPHLSLSNPMRNANIFLAKYNENGVVQWATKMSHVLGDNMATGITVDAQNDLFVVGRQKHPMDLYHAQNEVQIPIPCLGKGTMFLVKYSDQGHALWKQSFGSASSLDTVNAVATQKIRKPNLVQAQVQVQVQVQAQAHIQNQIQIPNPIPSPILNPEKKKILTSIHEEDVDDDEEEDLDLDDDEEEDLDEDEEEEDLDDDEDVQPPPLPPKWKTTSLQKPIFFPEGAVIMTDQGGVRVEQLHPQVHTIRSQKIVQMQRHASTEKHVVKIARDAFFRNYPCADTYLALHHPLLHKKEWREAKDHVNSDTIKIVEYPAPYMYSLLLEKMDSVQIHNLVVKSTPPPHPTNEYVRKIQEHIEKKKTERKRTGLMYR
jgi:hypothetical protein